MKLVSYKCPNCNASIQVDDTKRSFFCTYCGSPVNIDLSENVFTYREINEAEIRRAEAEENIKKNKNDYKLKKMELKHKKSQEDWDMVMKYVPMLFKIIFAMLIFLVIIAILVTLL